MFTSTVAVIVMMRSVQYMQLMIHLYHFHHSYTENLDGMVGDGGISLKMESDFLCLI